MSQRSPSGWWLFRKSQTPAPRPRPVFPSGTATLTVADGRASEQDAAAELGISVHTVGFHLARFTRSYTYTHARGGGPGAFAAG